MSRLDTPAGGRDASGSQGGCLIYHCLKHLLMLGLHAPLIYLLFLLSKHLMLLPSPSSFHGDLHMLACALHVPVPIPSWAASVAHVTH